MKNKKIIIDDINVSECKCYNPNIKMDCSLYPLQPDACKNNPNCYYKQFKRKEQECEDLKEQLTILDDEDVVVEITVKQFEEYKELKAENEELKKQACGLRPELKYIIDKTCCKYNINAKYYHEKIVEIINKLDKYKQTLAEIKEMLQTIMETNKVYPLQTNLDKILQKINEVKNEN